MEAVNEMTEERLAELRTIRNSRRGGSYYYCGGEDIADCVDEIDRLRAELAAAKAENGRLWPWALNDFRECDWCIKCVACGGLGELCESHAAFVWDGCDCEPAP